jgi:D-lactate dehydrogenase
MPAIVFLEVDPEDEDRVRSRFPGCAVLRATGGEGLPAPCKEAEIVACFITSKFGKSQLQECPKLKLLCTRSVGYDHIDLGECQRRGITVCNVPDYGSHVIAEHVFALLLSATRHIREADERVESGEFDYHGLRGMSLKGKTIGVVGTGKIGVKVCQIAHGFGMEILAFDKCRTLMLEDLLGVRYVPLEDLLSKSDVVTLHVPATAETRHMINGDAIRHMKNGVVLINTARGDLIDTPALVEGIKGGKFSHVLLDVLEHEKNFEENEELIQFKNVVTTPHIAFYAEESMQRMYEDCFQSIDQFLHGETPAHVVKVERVVCDMPGLKMHS